MHDTLHHSTPHTPHPTPRSEVWSTCEGDRPLLAQFCANDPDYLVKAASMLAPQVDGVDINFGCPQRIAKWVQSQPP